ncbi:hypothetical protein [Halorubrum sp. DTA46]|uniref:hypothetical protein n=1 Tax=Halorubrum sp. DTA46 TaxID=3402162 RepID=UPI003AB104EA
MQPTDLRSAAQNRSIGHDAAPMKRSLKGSLAFAALLALPFLLAAYPVVAVALVAGGVALAVLSRSVADHVRRHGGSVRHVTLPGFGTLEYRFTRT